MFTLNPSNPLEPVVSFVFRHFKPTFKRVEPYFLYGFASIIQLGFHPVTRCHVNALNRDRLGLDSLHCVHVKTVLLVNYYIMQAHIPRMQSCILCPFSQSTNLYSKLTSSEHKIVFQARSLSACILLIIFCTIGIYWQKGDYCGSGRHTMSGSWLSGSCPCRELPTSFYWNCRSNRW